ncbi:MDR family NADP-dependent oxidoreductase [Bradyrhizobium tropiciagri]|uniref:MDR family NADP-dependent oxidoreductase n=1 Tax=Bradyrhizobium tropiciagri TaxID=312253 RepID=UPI00067E5210|nr:NADP-dependent oxidoreductase [Bradyrhizobium tropiciagri]
MNRYWTLAKRPPPPWPDGGTFEMRQAEIPRPSLGQALTRTIYISLDPYQWNYKRRGVEPEGAPCHARTVSQVVTSHIEGLVPGDFVFNTNGWAEYGLMGEAVERPSYMAPRKLDLAQGKISHAVGVLGMLGLTAYAGMILQCEPKDGDTVVVSAASGGVGQIAGQLAKQRGCRVIGIAGREEKCRYVTEELGFDRCVSHLSGSFVQDLQAACPSGVDVYFENVGGHVFQAVLPLFHASTRMTICGLIAHYGDELDAKVLAEEQQAAEARGAKVQVVWASEYVEAWQDAFLAEMAPLVASGKIRYREDVREGFESIPGAFAEMLKGANFGKALVRIARDPTIE